MTAEAIRTYLEASPFTPVKIITSSGKSYVVPHPDFLTFSPTGRTCLVYAEDCSGKARFTGKEKRRSPPRPEAVAFEVIDQPFEDPLAGDSAGNVAASVADGLLGGVGGVAGA